MIHLPAINANHRASLYPVAKVKVYREEKERKKDLDSI